MRNNIAIRMLCFDKNVIIKEDCVKSWQVLILVTDLVRVFERKNKVNKSM